MTRITPNLLNDTLQLIQLARETARAQGLQAQAERLTPVVDNLRALVSEARQPKAAGAAAVQLSELMAQDDFQALLAAVQGRSQDPAGITTPALAASPTDRGQIVLAMAASGMTELDIARQLGMTRDEGKLSLSVSRR